LRWRHLRENRSGSPAGKRGYRIRAISGGARLRRERATGPRASPKGGLDLEQARKLKDLESEAEERTIRRIVLPPNNARLKRLVADLSIEKQVLKDIAEGNL